MPHSSFHAVSVRVCPDAAAALSSAMATATKALNQQINQAQANLASFRVIAISHSHTLGGAAEDKNRAVVTALAFYEYD